MHAYQAGKRHGTGRYTWPNGDVYDGEWADGVQSGTGVKTYCNGDQYTGSWSNNKKHGKGTDTLVSGDRYVYDFCTILIFHSDLRSHY